jgi:two-component system phosphate regulon sensor histidine kinase PhoR
MQDTEHNVRFLERIRENADRLHRLVQDLLSLGRIESGQEAMEVQPIPLADAVDACSSRHDNRARAKGLRLEHHPPAEPVAALADEEAIAEILDNLVDNAIKYTPAGGTISLRWWVEGREAIVQVQDTGVGIPEKDLSRVFERFYRVDRARSRELGGTGLGLSIVKHLVQALGGSIAASSQVGQGSTFVVRLPQAREE